MEWIRSKTRGIVNMSSKRDLVAEERRIKILRTLLSKTASSKYKLAKRTHITQPTVLRYVEQLETEGLVTTTEGGGNRGQVQVSLTPKGFLYLLLKADLSKDEVVESVTPLMFEDSEIEKLSLEEQDRLKMYVRDSIDKLVARIRPRANLEFYNEKYVRNLIRRLMIDIYYEAAVEEAIRELPPDQKVIVVLYNLQKLYENGYYKLEPLIKPLYEEIKKAFEERGIDTELLDILYRAKS